MPLANNTIDQPGAFDAISKARPGEPLFALLGRDELAAPLVMEWADRNRRRAMSADLPDEKRRAELLQSAEAEEIAFNMAAYAKEQPAEPVVTGSARPAYSGFQPGAEMVAAKIATDARVAAARCLDEAAAQIATALELCKTHGLGGKAELVVMDVYLNELRDISLTINPPRSVVRP